MEVLFVAAAILAFFVYVYRFWDYKKKFTFKSVMIYISLGIFVLVVLSTATTVTMVLEEEQDKTLSARMRGLQYELSHADYSSIAFNMKYDADYEPEFEYLWEQLRMYEYSNRYQVFKAAGEELGQNEYTERAAVYEQKLKELCTNPEYAENADLGVFLLKRAGMIAE